MFSKRFFRSFFVRRFGDDFENVFKTYLQQAEEIERKAKAKAKAESEAWAEEKEKEKLKEGSKGKQKIVLTPLEQFLDSNELLDRLESASSPEMLQVELEQTLLTLNKEYYKTKDSKEGALSCAELLMSVKQLWQKSEVIRAKELTFAAAVRTIWALPLTKTSEDFGNMTRITKDSLIQHSPFIYGPLNDELYYELLQGVGNEKSGIRVIRRVLDHMAFYKHVPSLEVVQCLIEESISGKWPRVLYTTVSYASKLNIEIPHKTWVSVLNYYRFNKDFFGRVPDMLDLALKNGANPTFDLIQLYIGRYYQIIDSDESARSKITDLLDKLKLFIGKNSKNAQERSEKICDLSLKYAKFLLSINENKEANAFITQFIGQENFSLDSIEVVFKFFEELKDSFKAIRMYKRIVSSPSFVYTPKIVVALLRMCSVLGEKAFDITKEIEELIFNDKKLATPFGVNTIIISYCANEKWDNVMDFVSKCILNGITFNKFTSPTIRKMTETCMDQMIKSKLIEQAIKIEEILNNSS